MTPDNPVYAALVWIIPLVIAIVFHEVAHGLAARALGDRTAAEQKRLSLNPLRHVDPVGTVALPLVLALAKAPVFGWARPVPVRRDRLRNPRTGMMLVALAGPGMNLSLALVAAVLIGLVMGTGALSPAGGMAGFLAANLFNFLLVNIFLALFNLIPLPPFDGGHVVEGLLPRRLAVHWAQLARFGFPLLIVLLLVVPAIWPSANIVQRLVVPPAQAVVGWYLALAGAIA